MKKLMVFVLALTCSVLFAGCEQTEIERWVAKPSIMIDGVLYGTTGLSPTYRTDEKPENGGHVDGMITSSVAGHEYPVENDQSNFGTGYYYRYGENNTIEVFSDSANNWFIYEAYEDQ